MKDIQWNLRTRDTLGAMLLSLVERSSLSRRFILFPLLTGFIQLFHDHTHPSPFSSHTWLRAPRHTLPPAWPGSRAMKALKCKTLGGIHTRRLCMYVLHHAQSTSQLTPHHCSSICRVSAKLHTSTHAQPVSIAICKVRCYFCQQLSRLLHAGCESN